MPNPLFRVGKPRATSAFTLLEMSVAVAIIALVTGMGISSMQGVVESARITSTQEKMRVIEDALATYWKVNGRLPCPADGSLADSNSNFGIEAANNDAGCVGGTPAVNLTLNSLSDGNTDTGVQGIVPFETLGIEESLARDAWGSRFIYGVDTLLTRTNAARRMQSNDQPRGLRVANHVSSYAYLNYGQNNNIYAYALLSHGPDQFGAYLSDGTRNVSDRGSEEEKINAWVLDPTGYHPDATGDIVDLSGIGIKRIFIDSGGAYADFDDILRYKSVWQLNEGLHKTNYIPQERPVLFFSTSASPYLYAYSWNGYQFNRHTGISGTPSGILPGGIMAPAKFRKRVYFGNGARHHGDTTSENITQWTYQTHYLDTLTRQVSSLDFSSYSNINDIIFGPFKDYGVLIGNSTFSTIFFDVTEDSAVTICSTSTCTLDSTASNTPGPGTEQRGGDISPYGHLAIGTNASSSYLAIYQETSSSDGMPRIEISSPVVLPTGQGNDAAYSPDGKFLAVAHDTSPYVSIYEVHGTTYSKLSNPSNLPGGNATSVSFSDDSQFMVVGHAGSPYITVYSIDTDSQTFTKLDNPTTLPSGTVNDVDFAPGEPVFAAAVNAGSPPLMLFRVQNAASIINIADPDVLPSNGSDGYAVKFVHAQTFKSTKGIVSDGLVGRWRFDESTGTEAADSSSSRNDGTLTNATYSTETPTALASSGHSASFDGTNDRIEIANSSSLQLTDTMTISAWIRPGTTYDSGLTLNVPIVNRQGTDSSSNDSYGLYINSDGELQFGSQGGNIQSTTASWTSGTWYHIVGTYDDSGGSTTGNLYINGTAETLSTNSYDSMSATTNELWIGESSSSSYQDFSGQIDDVRIYNRVLSEAEIARIYAGNG